MYSSKRGGFTLVEILIVVVILGILAAIVIPQFTNASETAKASSLASQLQTLRSQIELFQVQHNGDYPEIESNWTVMLSASDPTEHLAADVGDGPFGPYLQEKPINPFTGGSDVAADDSADWIYSSGTIKAVFPGTAQEATDLGLDTTNDVTPTG